MAFGAIALSVVTWLPPAAASTAAQPCNGSARLCNLSLGAVAFATTHNSMASRADGFVPPNQGWSIEQQLRHGIRGFQIDVYPGVPRKGRVWTDLAAPFGSQTTDLPRALVATATRIHEQLGAPPPGTPTHVYLCHTFCELGATRLSVVARQFRDFLDEHPREVFAFVIEDYVVPERIRAVFDAAGLGNELTAVVAGGALPTLGGMIATPAGDRRSRAVNYRVLRERIAECARVRGRGPTLVAVDFAEDSDVLEVVDRLNRDRA
jgi:hypothetical protein